MQTKQDARWAKQIVTSALVIGMTAVLCLIVLPAYAQSIDEAIVKVFAVYNRPDYYNPWQMEGAQLRTGSGCIIAGNRVLTSAAVVADQIYVQVRRADQATTHLALVRSVAHESDLAILEVIDKEFFADVVPLQIGDLPSLRDRVVVYGFPTGGEELAITEAVVSRIEHQFYKHNQEYLLACQIDVAIAPGNFGGPVIKDGEIVGVAIQAGRGESIGAMVPAPLIERFLADIEDGTYDGMPGIGIVWQRMENPDLRARFKMSEELTGILINKVLPGSPAEDLLQPGDVILALDDTNIENDGSIEFRPGGRTSFSHLVQSKFIGDVVRLHILRDGQPSDVEIQFTKTLAGFRLVPNERFDVVPRYAIVGGLVFEPLTLNLLQLWGEDWYSAAPRNLANYYRKEKTEDRSEIIVLVRVLADEVNTSYHDYVYEVILEVNGTAIADMENLIEAFESNTNDHHIIITESGETIVLDRVKAEQNGPLILKTYGIGQ